MIQTGSNSDYLNSLMISNNGILPMSLGNTDDGKPFEFDLTEAQNIFITGNAKTGKTSLIKSMVFSLIFPRVSKLENLVKLVVIQTEGDDLSNSLNGISHLICPVIRSVKWAFYVLRRVCDELNNRIDLILSSDSYSFTDYNKTHREKIPYYIVIIDEIADLSHSDRKQFNFLVRKLLSTGYQYGIHLILSTRYLPRKVTSSALRKSITTSIVLPMSNANEIRSVIGNYASDEMLNSGELLYLNKHSLTKPTKILMYDLKNFDSDLESFVSLFLGDGLYDRIVISQGYVEEKPNQEQKE